MMSKGEQKSRTLQGTLRDFLMMPEEIVLGAFARLPDAQDYSPNFVFVPGKRKTARLLLIAHADTVETIAGTPRHALEPRYDNPPWLEPATGADDRAGCAILWELRNSGHSLLITTGEEDFCVGAEIAGETIPEALAEHAFAIELDRHGEREFVTYEVGTKPFVSYLQGLLPRKWVHRTGTWTDIVMLCPMVGICGVNLSVGYMGEHTSQERINLHWWFETVGVMQFIARITSHPKFKLERKKPSRPMAGVHLL